MSEPDRQVTVELVEGYRAEARAGTHGVTMDEPLDQGGTDQGPTPIQLLLTSLGGCSAITMRLYAERKGWDLRGAKVAVKLYRGKPKDTPRIVQEIELEGDLAEDQRQRLLEIAGRCPVHRLVDGPLETEERFA